MSFKDIVVLRSLHATPRIDMKPKKWTACYGNLFPDLQKLKVNEWNEGKVFRVRIEKKGKQMQPLIVEVDQDQWDKCVDCVRYTACYDLSMAKLTLVRVLS